MADSNVLSALTRKYALILGELRQCEGRSDKLRADLVHIEATIRLFRADWDSEVRPRRPRKASRWLRHGDGVRTAIDVLRASPVPMTSREIAVRVLALAGVDCVEAAHLNAAAHSIAASLKLKSRFGVVGDDSRPRRWRIET